MNKYLEKLFNYVMFTRSLIKNLKSYIYNSSTLTNNFGSLALQVHLTFSFIYWKYSMQGILTF